MERCCLSGQRRLEHNRLDRLSLTSLSPAVAIQNAERQAPHTEGIRFEDSTFASARRIHTRSPRYAAGSFVLQTAFLATLILVPYLYPTALPRKFLSISLIAPPPPPAAPVAAQTSTSASRSQPIAIDMTLPTHVPHDPALIVGTPSPVPPGAVNFGGPAGPGVLPLGPAMPPVEPRIHPAKPTGPIHVSSGVATGQLIVPIQPHYPAIALATRTQGTIIVSAIIGKDGRIESLRVLSGPPLLVQAAVDAIRQARYRPWTLNGEPVEVETTINIVFSLGDQHSSL